MANKPAAGNNAVSYCTKCRMDLNHTIIALSGGKIMKVKCKTCGGEHKYRDRSKEGAVPRKRSAPGKKGPTAEELEKRWEEAMEKSSGQDIPYSMTGRFKVSDVVMHETFGRGLVLSVAEKKMTIRFRDKERILVSSR